MAVCCVNEFGELFLDGICCKVGPSCEEVVVDGLFPRGNSWAERGSMQEIQEFGLVFLHIRRFFHVHIIWMGSRQGITVMNQVDRPNSVGGISMMVVILSMMTLTYCLSSKI